MDRRCPFLHGCFTAENRVCTEALKFAGRIELEVLVSLGSGSARGHGRPLLLSLRSPPCRKLQSGDDVRIPLAERGPRCGECAPADPGKACNRGGDLPRSALGKRNPSLRKV